MSKKLIEQLEKLSGKKVILTEGQTWTKERFNQEVEDLCKDMKEQGSPWPKSHCVKEIKRVMKDNDITISDKKSLKEDREDDGEEVVLTEDTNSDVENQLEVLFQELVPSSGAAETFEGEMVRAIMRVWYRYYNDGDYYFRGYGRETAGPTVQWLKTKTPISKQLAIAFNKARANAVPQQSRLEYTEQDGYLNGIKEAAKLVVDYVKSKNGEYTPNTGDSRG